MTRLQLSLLGSYQVTLDGELVTQFESDKVRALLAYLAVEDDRPHRRDALAALLWPEASARLARANLRNALANLRKAIGDRTATPPFLLIAREAIQFNKDSDSCLDTAVFHSLLQAPEKGEAGLHQLQDAVALYRGAFLEGFSLKDSLAFDDWSLLTRERLQRLALKVLRRLAQEFEQRGDYETACEYAWRQVEIEPWQEQAHRQLMRLLAYNRQRSAALAQYHTCCRLLSEDLSVSPAAETTRLYEQIRDGIVQPPVHFRRPAMSAAAPPYRGLQFFDRDDADWFFGREVLTARLVHELSPSNGCRFLAVVGASGSGKSSIVRAGLVPALAAGEPLSDGTLPPAGSEAWPVRVITPTARPLRALAAALAPQSASQQVCENLIADWMQDPFSLDRHACQLLPPQADVLLLVVDQFEELFTLCHQPEERQVFVECLMTAAARGRCCIVVIALRADFYAHCGHFESLRQALQERQIYIGPMSGDELRRAITAPAERGGWELEPGLGDFLLREVRDEPGALPLLSHALLETWQRRRGRLMTFAGYEETGGIRGAIAQTAERVLQELDPHGQVLARNIFVRLTALGEGTQYTHRRASLAELVTRPEDEPAVRPVLQTLADARLITTTKDSVEIAHEALIREWPTLRGWLEEDRDGLRIHRHLTAASQGWGALQRDPGELYRGARLAEATEWAEAHASELNPLEREFLTASQDAVRADAAEREARRQAQLRTAQRAAEAERQRAEQEARSARRLRIGAALLAGLSVVAVILATVAFEARSTARQERDNARREAALNHSLVLAAHAQRASDNGEADLALALALEAVRVDPQASEPLRTLSAVAMAPSTRAVLREHGGAVQAVAFAAGGRLALCAGCADVNTNGACSTGETVLWNLETGAPQSWLAIDGALTNQVAVHSDGETALSGGADGSLILWDLTTGTEIRRLQEHGPAVNCVSFHPTTYTALSAAEDASLLLWDVQTGQLLRRLEGHRASVTALAAHPDGSTVLSGGNDGLIILSDLATGEEVERFEGHQDGVTGVAFGPAGSTVLSTSADHSLRQWDAQTGEQLREALFPSPPGSLLVLPDGRSMVFSVDFELRLWDIQEWKERYRLLGHQSAVEALAVSRDGRLALSGTANGCLRLWNLLGLAELRRFPTDGVPLIALAIDPHGRYLLTGDMADRAILWSIESGEAIRTYQGRAGAVSPGALAFHPDGTQLLVGSGDVLGDSVTRSLVLWDVASGEQVRAFKGHVGLLRSVAFLPDGHTALCGSQSMNEPEGDLILWDMETGELLRRFDTNKDITSIAVTADGRRALTGSAYFEDLELWDVASGRHVRSYEGHRGPVFAVRFCMDERAGLSASEDGSLILWDLETGEVIRRFLGHERGVWGLDIHPSGRYAVSSSEDGTAIIWDLETGEALQRFAGHAAWVPDVVFADDGRTAFSISLDGTLIQWQAGDRPLDELLGWIDANRYVRELTCDERAQYRVEPMCDGAEAP